MPIKRQHFPDIQTLVAGFTDYATTVLNDTLAKQAQASLVVPGGSTPRHFLPELAKSPLPWDRITITLSDERWVDTTDETSNERLIREHLLQHLPDDTRFIGLKTPHNSPIEAINEVEQRLNTIHHPISLTILGLGEDGHIASLFPGIDEQTKNTTRLCIATDQPIAPSSRISLSLSLLTRSEHIALVVTGKQKCQLLNQVEANDNKKLPISWLTQDSHSPITIFETNSTA